MKTLKRRWDLSNLEVSASAEHAALRVVGRLAHEKNDLNAQWATAIRLAHANGASLREIAEVAGVSPQTVANICKRPAS